MNKLISYGDNGKEITGYVNEKEIIIVGYDKLRIRCSSTLPNDVYLAEIYAEVYKEVIKRAIFKFNLLSKKDKEE
jgi:hypothetical protein